MRLRQPHSILYTPRSHLPSSCLVSTDGSPILAASRLSSIRAAVNVLLPSLAMVDWIRELDTVAACSTQQQRGSSSLRSQHSGPRDKTVQSTLCGINVRMKPKNPTVIQAHSSSSGKSHAGGKRQASLPSLFESACASSSTGFAPSTEKVEEDEPPTDAPSSAAMVASSSSSHDQWQVANEDIIGSRLPSPLSKRKHTEREDLHQENVDQRKRLRVSRTKSFGDRRDSEASSVYDNLPGATSPAKASHAKSCQANSKLYHAVAAEESEAESTQLLDWGSDAEVSPLPKPVTQPKSDRKRLRVKRRAAAFAPAISPSKRKSLIEQSAKDYAIQQARRSRGPLQEIGNLSVHANGTGRDKTPSPLRAGFSLIQIDHHVLPDSSETEDEIEDFEGPPSPLLQRGISPASKTVLKSMSTMPSVGVPRIYAFETQKVMGIELDSDALGSVDPALQSTHLYESKKSAILTSISKESERDGRTNTSNDDATAPAIVPSSSQTAPGGSWPIETHASSPEGTDKTAVKYGLAEHGSVGNSWRNGRPTSISSSLYVGGDPYDRTSSQMTLTGVAAEVVDRSNRDHGCQEARTPVKGRQMSATSTDDEIITLDALADMTSLHLEEDETQPLAWETSSEEGQTRTKSEKQRLQGEDEGVRESQVPFMPKRSRAPHQWKELDQVWAAYLHSNKAASSATLSKPSHQYRLNDFGFSRAVEHRSHESTGHRDEHPMSDAEEVPSSDDDHEEEKEEEEEGESTTTHADTLESGASQSTVLSVPSDTGLDSQVKDFFNVL